MGMFMAARTHTHSPNVASRQRVRFNVEEATCEVCRQTILRFLHENHGMFVWTQWGLDWLIVEEDTP
jgi:hypothetical protein